MAFQPDLPKSVRARNGGLEENDYCSRDKRVERAHKLGI